MNFLESQQINSQYAMSLWEENAKKDRYLIPIKTTFLYCSQMYFLIQTSYFLFRSGTTIFVVSLSK